MTPVFEALVPGDIAVDRELALSRDTLVRYAGASGDFNPIHYRDDVAREVGLPGVLAHGMLTMGAAASPLLEWLGAAAVIVDYQARFTRPVPVDAREGARLRVTATIGAIDAEARTARFDLAVTLDEQRVLGKAQLVAAFS